MKNKTFPRVDADLAAMDETAAKMRTEFGRCAAAPANIEWVKRKLRHMVDVDQYVRKLGTSLPREKYSQEETEYFWQQLGPRVCAMDGAHTRELKTLPEVYRLFLLGVYGWFKISEFGREPDQQAWLLVQHSDCDLAFQKAVLRKLEALYPEGECDPTNYAYLFDRVAVNEGRPQRYGTQGQMTGPGKWEPDPMEDPAGVDERRKAVALEPLEEYKKRFSGM